MGNIVETLQDPQHVVNFQRACGLVPQDQPWTKNGKSSHAFVDDTSNEEVFTSNLDVSVYNSTTSQDQLSTRNRKSAHASVDASSSEDVFTSISDVSVDNSTTSQDQLRTRNGKYSHAFVDATSSEDAFSSNLDVSVENSIPCLKSYNVNNKYLHYLFLFGSSLGDEIFYITFFPLLFWNIDGFLARRVYYFLWIYMYVGQASKDIIRWPRPPSPPVIRMDCRYELEYGMPSTHAMIGTGIPFVMLCISVTRYQYPVIIGVVLAVLWTTLVCCSRIYLGMHSLLDLAVGVAAIAVMLPPYLYVMPAMDEFCLHHPWSPYVFSSVPLLLCIFYPSMDKWSTARGDTTIIVSVMAGIALGLWNGFKYGVFQCDPFSDVSYEINVPTLEDLMYIVLRTVVGILVLLVVRSVSKIVMFKVLCYLHGINEKHIRNLHLLTVELPYTFITYSQVAFFTVFVVPQLHCLLGIQRDSFFKEYC